MPILADAHRKLWRPVETLHQTKDFALLTWLKKNSMARKAAEEEEN